MLRSPNHVIPMPLPNHVIPLLLRTQSHRQGAGRMKTASIGQDKGISCLGMLRLRNRGARNYITPSPLSKPRHSERLERKRKEVKNPML